MLPKKIEKQMISILECIESNLKKNSFTIDIHGTCIVYEHTLTNSERKEILELIKIVDDKPVYAVVLSDFKSYILKSQDAERIAHNNRDIKQSTVLIIN